MTLVLSLLGELVFASVESSQRRFGREMNEYLEQRGLPPQIKERPASTR
jgi:hypothetical protein